MQVQKPTKHAKPYLMELVWRIDCILSIVFGQKRQFTKATAKASYSKSLYSNQKIKDTLHIEFTDIKEYIKVISKLKA